MSSVLVAAPASLAWQFKEQQTRQKTVESAQRFAELWVRHYGETGERVNDLRQLDLSGDPELEIRNLTEDRFGNNFDLWVTPANTYFGQVRGIRAVIISYGPNGKLDSVRRPWGELIIGGDDIVAFATRSQLQNTPWGITQTKLKHCNQLLSNYALLNEGKYPEDISALIAQGFAAPHEITDGWGRLLNLDADSSECRTRQD